ncbi:MAG: ankyrin repeat domain-containing protein [Candidatus Babeliaceae bacterium]
MKKCLIIQYLIFIAYFIIINGAKKPIPSYFVNFIPKERPISLLSGINPQVLQLLKNEKVSRLNEKFSLLLDNPTVNIESLQPFIDQGIDLNVPDQEGNTPLHKAVLIQRPDIVALLLKNNAQKNVSNKAEQTPLVLAIHNKNKAIFDLLYNRGEYKTRIITDSALNEYLFSLVKNNKIELIQNLVHWAPDLLKDAHNKANQTLVNYALSLGREEIALLLIEKNIFNETEKNELLNKATYLGFRKVVVLLVEKGAQLVIKDFKNNAFLSAVEVGNIMTVRELLKTQKNNLLPVIQEAFMKAIAKQNEPMARLLIKNGANINSIQDDEGNTLLLQALLSEKDNQASFLIELGAEVNIRNNNGHTALGIMLLRKDKNNVLITMLEARSAQITTQEHITFLGQAPGEVLSQLSQFYRNLLCLKK